MPWNWQLPDWPHFQYDPELVRGMEKQFLLDLGASFAYLKTIETDDYHRFMVEILSQEGLKSSKIEGEVLDRESLQLSIRQQFALATDGKPSSDKEHRMAELLCLVYRSYDEPLTHEMVMGWHAILFNGSDKISTIGKYRDFPEPMQIVSNRYGSSHVYFEAPPSNRMHEEMQAFIKWFNSSIHSGSVLCRAAIAHLYFESIHPFEDGNGRIGRLIAEKALSQSVGRPILIAISKTLESRKKQYYAALEKCNRTCQVSEWIVFFAQVVIDAYKESTELLYFLIGKSKLLHRLVDQINPRQTKVLLRMFAEGPKGFQGGLSADKYIAITKATRASATRDLADLVKKGALIKTGKLRHTRYFLNLPQ